MDPASTLDCFPHKEPYEQQRLLMRAVYECCHFGRTGVFESPTGTGKTLSILCSTLKWMEDRNTCLREGRFDECDGFVDRKISHSHCCDDGKTKASNGDDDDDEVGKNATSRANEDSRTMNASTTASDDEPEWMRNFEHEKTGKEEMNRYEKRTRKREETMRKIKLREREGLTRLGDEEFEKTVLKKEEMCYKAGKKRMRENLRDHLFNTNDVGRDDREQSVFRGPEQFAKYEELEFLPSDAEEEKIDDLDVFSSDDENDNIDSGEDGDDESMLPITRIIFCSRTHSQLSQCVSELKRTRFKENFASSTIASRKQLCVNTKVNTGAMSAQRINEMCLDMRKAQASSTSTKTKEEKEKEKNKKSTIAEATTTTTKKGCPFLVSRSKATKSLADRALVQPLDIEELSSMATKTKSCAYYAARQASKNADIIFMPYASLLSPDTREALGIELDPKNTVVIFDEAHNVADAVRSSSSAQVTRRDAKRAISMIENYIERFKERLTAENVRILKVLLNVSKRLVSVLTMTEGEKRSESSSVRRLTSLNDFLFASKLDDVNVFELVRFLKRTKIAQKIAGYGEYVELRKQDEGVDNNDNNNNSLDDRDWSGAWEGAASITRVETLDKSSGLDARVVSGKKRQQHSANVASVHAMANFIHALGSEDADGRILVEKLNRNNDKKGGDDGSNGEDDNSVKFVLLDVASRFRDDIVKKCRATILVGGTLAPFEELLTQLVGYSDIIKDDDESNKTNSSAMVFSCDHVVNKSNVLPLAISKGPSGKTFDFTSKNLKLAERDLLDDLGRCVLNLSKVCIKTGGIIVFYPSFSLMERCYNRWDDNGGGSSSSMLQMMRKSGKAVFKEPRDNAQLEKTLVQFSNACGGESPTYENASKTGAILLCVVNGKLSEGINFKDNLGRMVIIVGLPFANVKDEELSARMQYLDLQQQNVTKSPSPHTMSAGRAYYEALCARGVNQSVGRAIRHKEDYATMVFLDQRWCEKNTSNNNNNKVAMSWLGRYQKTLPGWISRELKVIDGNFGEAVREVAQFFRTKR